MPQLITQQTQLPLGNILNPVVELPNMVSQRRKFS